MSLRKLPEAKTFARPQNFQWDAPSDVLAKWAETPAAAASDDETTITMFDVIGEDWWTGGGVTAKRVAGALRVIGDRAVTLKINSPGGDMFEGIAIYNLLRQHPAKVTVEVMGWAASAASIIAMAGDEINMGLGTFMMVHNAWGAVVGNQHDFREGATLFEGFDAAIADIYEARTGMARAEITKLMDGESFMGPTEAVEKGFADNVDDGLKMPEADAAASTNIEIRAVRQIDAALAKDGKTRSERRSLIRGIKGGTPDAAAAGVTQDADTEWMAAARRFVDTFK